MAIPAPSDSSVRASDAVTLHAELTHEIDEGPAGPQVGAFFDVDRTLLAGFSVITFVRHGVAAGTIGPAELARTVLAATLFQLGQIGFSSFVTGAAGMLRNHSEAEAAEMAERVFEEALAADVYPESRALVQAHRRKGHTVALVSSATRYQIEPLARDLGIPHILCTELEVREGRFSGEVRRPTCYGEGKARAVRELAATHGIELEQSYFYTDSDEDLPLLEIVGNPRPTNANASLSRIAARRRWPVRHFSSRGTPGVLDVLRTSLAIGSLLPTVFLGAEAGLLDASWRRFANLVIATWGEVGTALAGVDLRVSGEEHLWSARPAVFIFNHQSAIDMLLLAKMLRRDIVGVAKQEVKRNPIFGPLFSLAGTVFIDRFNHRAALAALKPAVDALRSGLSLVMAPEGTRSVTPKLGRFKKGAFHLAMAAGVPIVPIVFRNALDALPKHGVIVRPSTVEAVIHPPIPTTGWHPDELEARIAEIHRLYRETLGEESS